MSEKKRPPTSGTWVKGIPSPNPGGRAKELVKQVREQFKDDVPKIVQTLRDLALGMTPTGYEEAEIKTSDRIKAGSEVLDRVLGKAVQAIEGDVNVGISPEQAALIAGIQLTPHERRKRLEAIAAEDDAALAEGLGQDQDQYQDPATDDEPIG